MDTIFARATPPGRSGVAIIRISGPRAFDVPGLFGAAAVQPRRPALRRLMLDNRLLDEALVLGFAAGASFTGDPVLELQCHGSIAVVNAILRHLGQQQGFAPAQAGAFTRRALENGRLDLPQVEALADLIDAETEMQRQVAAQGFSGGFSARARSWRDDLLRAAALIEATIDFADEEVPEDVTPEVRVLLDRLMMEFDAARAGVGFAERLRDGFEVAIVGAPNVGKSTLLNALAGREAALTSDIAGTTRDVVELRMEIAGLPVTLLDTAGMRDGQDPVERAGIDLARRRAMAADLRLFLGPKPDGIAAAPGDLWVQPKCDSVPVAGGLAVSGKTGAGLDALMEAIGAALSGRMPTEVSATRERHKQALGIAISCLQRARHHLDSGEGALELAAAELRKALAALNGLLGHVGVEDMLGEIFSSFCIGK